VLRKRIAAMVAMVMMVLMMAAPPALAGAGGGGQDGVKDPQPASPRGRDIGQGNEPEDAADPRTGRSNKIEHGCPQNGSVCDL
jgi:hypothetical protein